MELPVMPPVSPMLAKAIVAIPNRDDLWFEPKWDGFRCIVFRDGDEVELGSRNERPLTRYFPELLDPLRAALPDRCVIDGEIVVPGGDGLDFEALLQRIHPADSRVQRLATETPASFVGFDLLALDDEDWRRRPFGERHLALAEALGDATPPIHLTPGTTDRGTAEDWFDRFEGAGLDGVIAKPVGDPYVEGKRTQFKIKHKRTAECVVAAYRVHKSGDGVGSLLLGLYDDTGTLQFVGGASAFKAKERPELAARLAPYVDHDPVDHPWVGEAATGEGGQRRPGAENRWNAAKDKTFVPLEPELVAEVAYDQLQGGRFRHSTHLLRWRDDRDPTSCTYDQLEVPVPSELHEVFGA
ncbi:MAG: ATP-dependent DNA ligase [Acidimicrobiales bacterium]|nr:ATP-dependent DNA ligase [Acidimicrobiales bacterium]